MEEECEPCDTGDEVCVVPNPERCGIDGEEGNDSQYLRRLVAALSYRTYRKRILQAALRRYSPLHEPLVKSGDELYLLITTKRWVKAIRGWRCIVM